MAKRKSIGVAVCGLGNVGGETARLLRSEKARLSASLGAAIELRWVVSRRAAAAARKLGLPASVRRAKTAKEALRDPAVDVVVELFGGLGAAQRLVLDAFAAGKHVVTANKHLVSERFAQLHRAARSAERGLAFEAAVAGGIPIIGAIRDGLAANRIERVVGIFNGTTNYILSKMADEGCEMGAALAEAQRLGMAERDPTMDVNGMDAAHKIAILGSMLSGRWVDPNRVTRQGVERVEAEDVRFALERLGRTLRLLGTVAPSKDGSAVEAHVQPSLVPLDHPLAAVHGGYNAVLVQASSAEDLMFYGKGAGPGPTASAVLADVLRVARGSTPHAPRPVSGRAKAAPETEAPYYLKLRVADVPGALSGITGRLGREGVSIAQIYQDERGGRAVPVMILTHRTARAKIERAAKAILRLRTVSRRHSLLRLLPDGQ
jgi:homoserine dehydrogenase